jgi:hypothetical protein
MQMHLAFALVVREFVFVRWFVFTGLGVQCNTDSHKNKNKNENKNTRH